MLIGTINSVQYLNGSIQGIQGATGNGIASIVLNNDYTLTVNYTDGTSYTSGSIRGATGATGATPSLSMGNVITGAAGSDAEATITGTDTNPVLNLTLPRGETGNVSLEQLYALAIKQSISGEIASFSDGGDNLPMPKCEVTLDPIQDLHGYDAPWVGGAGKNKLPSILATLKSINTSGTWNGNVYTYNGITYTVNDDMSIKVNGTASARSQFHLVAPSASALSFLKSGTYILSGCPSGGSTTTYRIQCEANGTWGNDTGNGYTFTRNTSSTADETVRIDIWTSGVSVNNITFYPMIRLSSEADATYEPYENICPISGSTEVKTTRTGKNFLPKGTTTSQNNITYTVGADGVVTLSGSAASADNIFSIQFTVGESGNYYFSGCADGGNMSTTYDVFLYDVTNSSRAKKWDGTTNSYSLTNSTTSAECKLSTGVTYQYRIRVRNGFVPSGQKFYPMVRKSTGSATYEPYNGNTYTTALGRTVYGGTLDLVSGGLSDEWTSQTINGANAVTDIAERTNSIRFWYYMGTSVPQTSDVNQYAIIADGLKTATTDPNANDVIGVRTAIASPYSICCSYPKGLFSADATSIKNYLQSNPLQIVYKKRTPQTYQLTPQQIQTLLGQNNVWSDAGEMALVYLADTKLYINNIIS